MRVTFASPTVNMRGGTKVIAAYAHALTQLGHDVCVVCPPEMKTPIARKVKTWLKGDGWPANRDLFSLYFENNNIDLRVLERWRPITDRDVPDADVVIATWWQTAEWVAALAARKGVKVYFIQGHEVYDHLPVARVQATYRTSMHKIVVSQWLSAPDI